MESNLDMKSVAEATQAEAKEVEAAQKWLRNACLNMDRAERAKKQGKSLKISDADDSFSFILHGPDVDRAWEIIGRQLAEHVEAARAHLKQATKALLDRIGD